MSRLIFVLMAVLLSGCAMVDRVPTNYKGVDSGQVVVGIAASDKAYTHYALLFRKRDETQPAEKRAQGQFNYSAFNFLMMRRGDYKTSRGTGDVLVHTLPAGEYEIYRYQVSLNTGQFETTHWSIVPVSIPFSVKAGQTIYLGNYTAYRQKGKNVFGMPVSAGAVFVVEDRLTEDLQVAKNKGEQLPETVVDVTPKPEQLTTPVFVPRESFRLP